MTLILLPLGWVVRNTLFLRRRDADLYAVVDQGALIQIIIVFLLGLVILSSKPFNFWNDLKATSGRWWIILCLFGGVSYFWSTNPNYSVYRALEFLTLFVATMFVILNSDSENNAQRNALLLSWTVLSLEILGNGISSGFNVIGMKNNASGACATMIACYSWGVVFAAQRENRITFITSGIISSFLVVHSMSIASWWALLIGLFFIAIASRQKWMFVFLFLILIVLFNNVDQATIDQFIFRYKADLPFDKALRGRQYIWQDYWSAFQVKPYFGYGFSMAGREVGNMHTTNAHNFIFGIAVGMGMSGLALFILFFLKFIFETISNFRFKSIFTIGISAALLAGFVNALSLSLIGENWITPSYIFACFFSFHLYEYLEQKNALLYYASADEGNNINEIQ